MCSISIIILFNDNLVNLKTCLDSILNQTLKNIELICVDSSNSIEISYFLKKYMINNKIDILLCNSFNKALIESAGDYLLVIRENIRINNETCELLFNQVKYNDLDMLLFPIIDEDSMFHEDTLNFNHEDIFSLRISPLNFSSLYKKKFIDLNVLTFNDNSTLFYHFFLKSGKKSIFNKKFFHRNLINKIEIFEFISSFFSVFDNIKLNSLFLILIQYLELYSLENRQNYYNSLKFNLNEFTHIFIDNLNEGNILIYDIISKYDYYLDFLSEFTLENLKYEIYGGSLSKEDYKISIVIPIFNNENLIHRTLMSIENQSFDLNSIEVLMINDASLDNTSKIINEYADKYPNFKAIHIKNGTGSAGTPRNLGLKLASADYVMYIDHDDFLEINSLEKLFSIMTKNNCDFVYGTYALIDKDQPIKFIYPYEKHGLFRNLDDNVRSITTPPSIWTKLFRKDFLVENNILFPTILGEDAIFMVKALKHAKGVYYLWDDIICYYNLNEKSYTSSLSYDYFVEGLVSEEYLFNLLNDWDNKEYYNLRGQGILDYYINRLMLSNLNEVEIRKLMPIFNEFIKRLNNLNITPKNERNTIVFKYILNGDVEDLIKFKKYKPNKIKVVLNKIFNKINEHSLR